MKIPLAVNILRRCVEGFLLGGVVGTLEYAAWQWLHGYALPAAFWPAFASLTGAFVACGWLAAELAVACLPRSWRPSSRGVLFTLLTLGGLVVSQRLDSGGLNVSHRRFQVELLALLAAAGAVHRLYGGVKDAFHPRRIAWVAASGTIVAASLAIALPRNAAPHPRAPATERPNVVVILVDTLRVDRMSLFGAARPTTPRLDALAQESFLFRRAYTPSSWTGPSVASILTGLKVREHGLFRSPFMNRGQRRTLAEHFLAHGYDTFGAVSTSLVGPLYGFHRGFRELHAPVGNAFFQTRIGFLVGKVVERWNLSSVRTLCVSVQEKFLPDGETVYGLADSRVVFSFQEFLDRRPGPFFAYLHLFEPHAPYGAPPPFRGRFRYPPVPSGESPPPSNMNFHPRIAPGAKPQEQIDLLEALYDEDVLAADARIDEIVGGLRAHGLLDRTLLAIVSDHGEEFFDHGGWEHGHQCFDELVRGLLMIRFPAGSPRGTSDVPVSQCSLARLLTDTAALPPLPGADEPILQKLAEGAPLDSRARKILIELYSVMPGHVPAFAAVEWPWKLVRHGEPTRAVEWLFNLDEDPAERRDASPAHPEIRERLALWLDHETSPPPQGPGDRPPPELLDRLRALGYLR